MPLSRLQRTALVDERARSAATTLTTAAHLGATLATTLPQARGESLQPTWPVDPPARARIHVKWPSAYRWEAASRWLDTLRAELSGLIRVSTADIPQSHDQVAVLEVTVDGRPHDVAIDFSDSPLIDREVRELCALVFKLQYAGEGYGQARIVPGGYVPVAGRIYRYLLALRRIKRRSEPRYDVYGRFRARGNGTREQALQLLHDQDRFAFEGGLSLVSYPVFLREAALSRICLDLPGDGDICFRLVDYLAVGCCVIRPRPENRLHVPLEDGENVRFVEPDLSDLVEVCAALLADDNQRRRLAKGAREYFDRYLRTRQLAGYYVDRCLSLLAPD